MFLLYQVSNVAACIVSIAIVCLATFVLYETEKMSIFDVGFMGLGLFVMLLSLTSLNLRRSPTILACYMLLTFVLFAFMLVLTLCFLISIETLVTDIAQAYADKVEITREEAENQLSDYLSWIGYAFLFFTATVASMFFSALFYRASILNNTDVNKSIYEESLRRDKKRQGEEEINAKSASERLMYEQKYPELAKYKETSRNDTF